MRSLQTPTSLEECSDAQKITTDSRAQAIDYCELVTVQAGLVPPSVCRAVYNVLLMVHAHDTHTHTYTHPPPTHRQTPTHTRLQRSAMQGASKTDASSDTTS